MTEERQTGRTTKLITAALEKAKEDKYVIFYVGTTNMVWYAKSLAQEILGEEISPFGECKLFPGEGRFVVHRWNSESERMRGRRDDLHVAFDHYLP